MFLTHTLQCYSAHSPRGHLGLQRAALVPFHMHLPTLAMVHPTSRASRPPQPSTPKVLPTPPLLPLFSDLDVRPAERLDEHVERHVPEHVETISSTSRKCLSTHAQHAPYDQSNKACNPSGPTPQRPVSLCAQPYKMQALVYHSRFPRPTPLAVACPSAYCIENASPRRSFDVRAKSTECQEQSRQQHSK